MILCFDRQIGKKIDFRVRVMEVGCLSVCFNRTNALSCKLEINITLKKCN